MQTVTTLSTEPLAPRERAPAWRQWMHEHFGGLQSDLYGDGESADGADGTGSAGFRGSLCACHAGGVILTRLRADRHRVLRSRALARQSEQPYLKIVAPALGVAEVEQAGRTAQVGAGAWAIYDTTAPYAVSNPLACEHLVVMVPKERIAASGLRLDALMARQVGGAAGISRVALESMRHTFRELPHMSDAAAHGAGEMLLQLVQLSLLELQGVESAPSQRALLLDRIRQAIGAHLRDPGFTPERLAQLLNCSRRHLYNAFSGSGETPAERIQRQRLEGCMRDLRAPQLAGRSITEIALSWGFGNLSHFSRAFRAHTGLSPSEYREHRGSPGQARP